MMNVLVVDDEPIVLQGVCAIDWEKYGIRIAGTAANGAEAFQKCMDRRPDIILCDINMPVEDGLTLAGRLQEVLPETRVILLTGYSEQEYMLKALRTKVFDYLIKPVHPKQIIEAVRKAKADLERERAEKALTLQNSQLLSENMAYLQIKLMEQLVQGKGSFPVLQQHAALLGLSLSGPIYALAGAEIVPDETWVYRSQDASAFLAGYSPAIVLLENHLCCIVLSFPSLPAPADYRNLMQKLQVRLQSRLYYSGCFSEPSHFAESWRRIRDGLGRSLWDHASAIAVEEQQPFVPVPQAALDQLEKEWISQLGSGRRDEAERLLHVWYETAKAGHLPNTQLLERAGNLLRQAGMLLHGSYETPQFTSAAQIAEALSHAANRQRRDGEPSYSGQIERILLYMERHYQEELTLEKAGEDLYLSATYLSHLLKDKTGRGFSGWVHHFRIEKAKKLLENPDLKNYEIAEQVGYHSYKIFAEHFQKATQMTTREYRQAVCMRNGSPE